MIDDVFLMLMQLMFGDHDQRQQANFRLKRKGVPDKLRLDAQHKGWGARQSLKQALQDAVRKEEFRQRTNRQHTAQAFSTRTNRPWGQFQEPTKSERTHPTGPPQLDLDAPMRSRGTIREHEPNFFGEIKKYLDSSSLPVKIIGNLFYESADAAYVSFLSLQRGNSRVNLAGEVVTGSRITDAGVETLMNAMSLPVAFTKVYKLAGLNTAQFSRTFKGTFITRLQPATRGFINRMYNQIHTRRQQYLIKGLTSSTKTVSEELPNNK